jgi:chromosome segregation ATPase
MEFSKSNKEF